MNDGRGLRMAPICQRRVIAAVTVAAAAAVTAAAWLTAASGAVLQRLLPMARTTAYTSS